jgi:Coenzyme PQQ synthesis protein D (PqqD)
VTGNQAAGRPAAGLTTTEVDGCFHIFNPRTQAVVALNETASGVWRLVSHDRSVGEIVDLLAEQYGVEANAIDAQVRQVLRDFAAQGLLAGAGS